MEIQKSYEICARELLQNLIWLSYNRVENLSEDFRGTLKAQGININEEFKTQIRAEWREPIKSDIRRVADENPESKNWYLKQVLAEEPIKLKVEVDKATGTNKKSLRRSR